MDVNNRLFSSLLIFFLQIDPFLCSLLCGYPGRPANGYVVNNRLSEHINLHSVFYTNEQVEYYCKQHCIIKWNSSRRCQNGLWTGLTPRCDCPAKIFKTRQSSTYNKSSLNMDFGSDAAIDGNHRTYSSTNADKTPWWEAIFSEGSFIQLIAIKPFDNVGFEEVDVKIEYNNHWISCSFSKMDNTFWIYQCPSNIRTRKAIIINNNSERWKSYISLYEVHIYTFQRKHLCGIPELPNNAKFKKTDEDEYIYSCKNGLKLMHKHSLKCRDNGTWSNKPPLCKDVGKCPAHDGHLHGRIRNEVHFKDGSSIVGTKMVVLCDHGYEMSGNKTIVCGSDGKWNGTVNCTKIDCGVPPVVSNGRLVYNGTTYKEYATISCDVGYSTVGNRLSTLCRVDGKWATPTPRCEVVDCGKPIVEFSSNLHFLNNNTKFGSIVTVGCDDDDYPSSNSLAFHCNEHGKWNITRSPCKDKNSKSQKNNLVYILMGSLIAVLSLLVPALVSYLCCFKNCCRSRAINYNRRSKRRESHKTIVRNDDSELSDYAQRKRASEEAPTSDPAEHIYAELEPPENIYDEPEGLAHPYAVTPLDTLKKQKTEEVVFRSVYKSTNPNEEGSESGIYLSYSKQHPPCLNSANEVEELYKDSSETINKAFLMQDNPVYS